MLFITLYTCRGPRQSVYVERPHTTHGLRHVEPHTTHGCPSQPLTPPLISSYLPARCTRWSAGSTGLTLPLPLPLTLTLTLTLTTLTKVHKLVGRINGRFGSLEHAPIVYLDQTVDFVDLCALY